MLRKVSIFKKVKKILISTFEGKTAEKSKTQILSEIQSYYTKETVLDMENYCRNKFNVRNNANENKKVKLPILMKDLSMSVTRSNRGQKNQLTAKGYN